LSGGLRVRGRFDAGFSNQPYFNRAFRSRFGLSPSDVREQARQKR